MNHSKYLAQVYQTALTKAWSFKRIANYLSIAAYVLATFFMLTSLTVMERLKELQYNRVLSNIPLVIATPKNAAEIAQQGWTKQQLKQLQEKLTVPITAIETYAEIATLVDFNSNLQVNNLILLEDVNGTIGKSKITYWLDPNSRYGLLVPSSLVYKYQLTAGQQVNLINRDKLRYLISGTIPVQRNFTIIGSYEDENFDAPVYTKAADGLKFNLETQPHLSQLRFFIDPQDTSQLVEQLQQLGFTTSDWRDTKGLFFASINSERNIMLILAAMLVLVALLTNLISFSFLVLDRDLDLAMFNLLGMNYRDIVRIFIYQQTRLLFKANLISVALLGLLSLLSYYLRHNADPQFSPYLIVQIFKVIPLNPELAVVLIVLAGSSLMIIMASFILSYFLVKIKPLQIINQYQ